MPARPSSDVKSETRRALLATAAVAPASFLPAIAAAAGEEPDPHPAWFAEWRALVDWCNGPGADGDGEVQDDLGT